MRNLVRQISNSLKPLGEILKNEFESESDEARIIKNAYLSPNRKEGVLIYVSFRAYKSMLNTSALKAIAKSVRHSLKEDAAVRYAGIEERITNALKDDIEDFNFNSGGMGMLARQSIQSSSLFWEVGHITINVDPSMEGFLIQENTQKEVRAALRSASEETVSIEFKVPKKR